MWTRKMDAIGLHDAFTPAGSGAAPAAAVLVPRPGGAAGRCRARNAAAPRPGREHDHRGRDQGANVDDPFWLRPEAARAASVLGERRA